MSELLYESESKFNWHLNILLGVFLMIFGIDLVILFLNTNNILIFIIVSGIYGIATIIILISMLGVFIVKRYGMRGDIILRGTIVGIMWLIPIIFFSLILNGTIVVILIWIFLIVDLVTIYLEKRRIEKRHNPNPDADLRVLKFLGNLFLVVLGIILIPIGIFVNGLILEFLPWIYYIGSYGLACFIIGGILIFHKIYGLYYARKEKRENQLVIKEKREDLNWLKHEYYDKERSIQDIADEINVSMMTVKKWLDKLENSTNHEISGLSHGHIVEREKQQVIKEKKEDLSWLKHEYYDKGRSIQDIADERNVSMIRVKKWLDKLNKFS